MNIKLDKELEESLRRAIFNSLEKANVFDQAEDWEPTNISIWVEYKIRYCLFCIGSETKWNLKNTSTP